MKGRNLGEFEQMVLLALLRLEGEGYGVTVRRLIQERTDRVVSIGQVYVALERLENKRLIVSRLAPAEAVRGGRAKRLFTVTDLGLAELGRARRAMRSMADGLVIPDGASSS